MSSLSIGSAAHLRDAVCIRSWYQWSRPSFMTAGIDPEVVRAGAALHDDDRASIEGVPVRASSAICLSGHDLAAAISAIGSDEQARLARR